MIFVLYAYTLFNSVNELRNSVLYSSPTSNERSGGTFVLWGLIYITGRVPASHVKVLHDSAYMGNSRPVGSLVSILLHCSSNIMSTKRYAFLHRIRTIFMRRFVSPGNLTDVDISTSVTTL